MPQKISERQRLQYLQAMGIEAWSSRGRAMSIAVGPLSGLHLPQADTASVSQEIRYEIGPGSGRTLLLCDRHEQAASPLASDIARCLDEVPVWAWRVGSGRQAEVPQPGFTLESAIEDRLFTRVLLFCSAAARQAGQPQVIGSARIIRAPALPELAGSPQQKRALWSQLVQHGWCAHRS